MKLVGRRASTERWVRKACGRRPSRKEARIRRRALGNMKDGMGFRSEWLARGCTALARPRLAAGRGIDQRRIGKFNSACPAFFFRYCFCGRGGCTLPGVRLGRFGRSGVGKQGHENKACPREPGP